MGGKIVSDLEQRRRRVEDQKSSLKGLKVRADEMMNLRLDNENTYLLIIFDRRMD